MLLLDISSTGAFILIISNSSSEKCMSFICKLPTVMCSVTVTQTR